MNRDKLLTEITDTFFRKAEKEGLNKDIVNECVADTQYYFSKDPKHKDKKCNICDD